MSARSLLLNGSDQHGRLGETGNHWLYDLKQDFRKFLAFTGSLKDKKPYHCTTVILIFLILNTNIFNIKPDIMTHSGVSQTEV